MRKVTINGQSFDHLNNTAFDNLPALLAAESSRQYNGKTYGYDYQVSNDDLNTLIDGASSFVVACLDGMASIGKLLAHVDVKEVENDIQQVGWLIKGLADTAITVTNCRDSMAYDLANRE